MATLHTAAERACRVNVWLRRRVKCYEIRLVVDDDVEARGRRLPIVGRHLGVPADDLNSTITNDRRGCRGTWIHLAGERVFWQAAIGWDWEWLR
jgi:hypothetical protein